MKILFRLCFFLVVFLTTMQSRAVLPQSDDSIAVINQRQDSINFIANLVGLRDLWWVQTAAANKYLVRPPANRDINYNPTFTDEEYLKRIKNINSVVKLSYNVQVRGIINLYTQRKRDLSEFMLGFSEYYFPIFEQIFDKEGLPQELKYLALIESALNPRATSKVGAVGLWQFMYSTGRMYGLKINSFVDERRDPIKATVAAAHFLKDLYGMFHDWNLAIASYNCGPGNVKKAIKRSGGKTDFWDIYPFLPLETRGYVPAYIAATYVMNYSEAHNLYPRIINIPTTVDTIMVKQRLHLVQVSDVLHIPLQMLEDMNPQYRLNIIPYDVESNPLFLPGEFGVKFIEKQDSIYAYKDSILFDPQYLNKQPARYAYTENQSKSSKNTKQQHTKTSSKEETTRYTVQKGDYLGKIATKYGITVQNIKDWNHLKSSTAMVGQKLIVAKQSVEIDTSENKEIHKETVLKEHKHKEKVEVATVEKTESKVEEKVAEKSSKETVEKDKKKDVKSSSNIIYYNVRAGDTLWAIAQKYPGVTESEIIKLNGLKNGNAIMKGMKLKIKVNKG